MFTGIIATMGIVKGMDRKREDVLLEADSGMDLKDLRVGDSIAVNGVCLTVVTLKEREFTADVSAETLAKTNLASLKPGDRVNLEKSLRLGDFLGGHLVLGHIDGLGRIFQKKTKSNSIIFGVEVDERLSRLIVEKGSVAVDGISLTVNECQNRRFYVNIVPHTVRETTLAFRQTGDVVNIETDIIGKYIERLLRHASGGSGRGEKKSIDLNFLVEHGYLK
jgi:riboflavin synthase